MVDSTIRVLEDEACDRFAEFENRKTFERRRTDPAVKLEEEARIAAQKRAHEFEADALWRLCTYRPQDLDEIRRRADHIIANVPDLELLDATFMVAFAKSLATESAE
ncbi:hypothetical protein RDV64_01575 [Acuticoccus sp. MNP-M23]|uniref:hypothetical protein n=1 Tax=Acuticoccus sp. MNP-M23 TaxID=3072793 RepID=UPI0028165CDD|nr:hypothetical protein [Acuticoccus sp. MNP-M23]WMS43122.1 hypothetical protein RDV64_01575 [Acuticoccus sp. MNP-M23]